MFIIIIITIIDSYLNSSLIRILFQLINLVNRLNILVDISLSLCIILTIKLSYWAPLMTYWLKLKTLLAIQKYVRRWFELPISTTLNSLIVNNSNYGLNFVFPSTKFIQCQAVIRNALKSSPNSDIMSLWLDSNTSSNI